MFVDQPPAYGVLEVVLLPHALYLISKYGENVLVHLMGL